MSWSRCGRWFYQLCEIHRHGLHGNPWLVVNVCDMRVPKAYIKPIPRSANAMHSLLVLAVFGIQTKEEAH